MALSSCGSDYAGESASRLASLMSSASSQQIDVAQDIAAVALQSKTQISQSEHVGNIIDAYA